MAEEVKEEVKEQTPAIDLDSLKQLITENVSSSVKTALEQRVPEQPREPAKADPEPDFWDDIVNSRVDGKLGQVSLKSQAAEDKLDFYTSDFWLEEVEEWLTEEDPVKRKAEKAALRKDIEEAFATNMKNNRPVPRQDLGQWVLGQKVTKDRTKYVENIGKKATKQRDSELAQARRGIDISSGTIADFNPQAVHEMSFDKVVETYGNVAF